MNPTHDAILEAEAWRQTAARWRKRALREGAPWRRKCAKLEAKIDDLNERVAELAEEKGDLSSELSLKKAPYMEEAEAATKALAQLRISTNSKLSEFEDLKRRMKGAGTVEALVVERDSLQDQVTDLKSRLLTAQGDLNAAQLAAHTALKERDDSKEKLINTMVNPARSRIRVLATRLGIPHTSAYYKDDDALTAELDRLILALQERAKTG